MTDSSPIATQFPVDAAKVQVLRQQLGNTAQDRGMVDVAYRIIDSPVGQLLLAATERGLVRVAFSIEGFEGVLDSLACQVSPRILEVPRQLDSAARELDEYFAGDRRAFDLPLDHRLSTGFRLQVHQLLPEIGYGKTRSYKDLATLLGRPGAVRAVGTACATNPLPVVVPCHRVLRSDGSLGGYLGGLQAKAALLHLEGYER